MTFEKYKKNVMLTHIGAVASLAILSRFGKPGGSWRDFCYACGAGAVLSALGNYACLGDICKQLWDEKPQERWRVEDSVSCWSGLAMFAGAGGYYLGKGYFEQKKHQPRLF